MISEADRPDILDSLRLGFSLTDAAKAMGTTERACRDLAATDEGWRADLAAAECEGAEQREPAQVALVAESPPWADVVAFSARQQAENAAELAAAAVPARDLRAWANATTREEAAAAVVHDPITGEVYTPRPVPKRPRKIKASDDEDEDDIPDWDGIRAEAAELAPGPFGHILWQEEQLAQRGFPRLSPCTLWNLEGFFASLKRWFLLLGGRGMGKSTLATRLASVLGLLSVRRIPPGQTWIWPFVSVLPEDAKRRLHEIQAILRDVYSMRKLKITSPDQTPTLLMLDSGSNSIAYVSFASTLGHVSGPNTFGCNVDEEEKILRSTGEIVGSLTGTFRARHGIRGFRMSSALTQTGTLISSCRKGDTLTNYVARIGPFLPDAVAGLLAVAEWEEAHGYNDNATRTRSYAETLTVDSFAIPSWLGNNTIGEPNEKPWPAANAAIATRIEAEAVEEAQLKGLTRYEYWMREIVSVPEGGAESVSLGALEVVGELSRYADMMSEDRGY